MTLNNRVPGSSLARRATDVGYPQDVARFHFCFHALWLSAGSAPACVGPPDRPAVAPQIFWRNVRSACSPRHARPRFKVKRSDPPHRLKAPDTHAAAKSP